MGAHHAPAHVARHTRPAHASSTTTGLRLGRLAGRGVLTASAALAMTGAGAGAALAHDTQGAGGLLADNDSSLLCGIFGGDRCSSDTESSAESSSDRSIDSSDASDSVFDRFDRFEGGSSSTGDGARSSASEERAPTARDSRDSGDEAPVTRPSSTGAQRSAPQQQSSPSQASQIDTPPPPGQVRSINLPN